MQNLRSTIKFEILEIVYQLESEKEGDGFAIAQGNWGGDNGQSRLAVRWFDPTDVGIGYPLKFGKPQWMLIPDECRVKLSGLNCLG